MDQVRTLHILFENGFTDAYRDAPVRKRRQLMPYTAALYRRWYYSTLIENTPFSPANIMESLCRYYGQDTALYPQVLLRNINRFSGFDIEMLPYGDPVHPIIGDLARIIDFCFPHTDIREGDYFFEAQQLELAKGLTIPDPAYADFLLDIVIKMKLLVKVPSLYINRLEVARDWEERLAVHPDELFTEIVEAALSISAHNLRDLIALPETIFTDTFVRSMFAEPVETDSLFEMIYEMMGYTLEDLVELSMESDTLDIKSPDGAFLASTFMMGVVLDRYFFTPFGHYLKLIRPLYVLPFDFSGEIDDFIVNADVHDDGELFIAFFAPCSNYTLTDLGLRIFGAKPTDKNYYDIAKNMPFSVLKDSLFADPEMIGILVRMAQFIPAAISSGLLEQPIYTFRVRMETDAAMWIHLQMPVNAYLSEIYDEVLHYFPLRENYDYIFFHDTTENHFAQYPSPKRAMKHIKKTAEITLDKLDFTRQPRMLLTLYNQALPFGGKPPIVRLEIEMMGEKNPDPDQYYPRVTRMSKAIREMEGEM